MTFAVKGFLTATCSGPSARETAGFGTGRRLFLDALRGLALILMVVNHTSRDWMDASMGWGRYYLMYGSLILPAATFLFLVGFCLAMSVGKAPASFGVALRHCGRRGALIVGAGLLLNILMFPENPVWAGGVLQTVGISIFLLGPALPLLSYRSARYGFLALAVVVNGAFAWSVPALARWSAAHPVLAQIWLFDFPPFPWVGAALIGLVLGRMFRDASQRGPLAEARYVKLVTLAGTVFLLGYVVWEFWFPTTPRFGFKRDFILNRHWTPRGVTTFLIIGGVACLLAAAYWLMEVKKRELRWLVTLGQAALMLYFVHQFIELTVVNKVLHWRFNNWPLYWAANAVLMVLLVYLGTVWLALKPLVRRPLGVRPLRARTEESV